MQYNQPLDQPTVPDAPYIDGDPAAGIQGSIVPGSSLEYDQREVVEVITRANVRGYHDFSGAACAVPSNADLMQLRKAIEGFINDINQFLITTEVTFTVHGAGADFPDLIAAFNYLGKYKITPTGHVILQLAGATTTIAQQFVYTKGIIADHPNNDRISIFGAPMLAGVPRTDAGYAWNGYSPAQRATDLTTNLAMLRSKFATEIHFTGSNLSTSWYPSAGLIIIGTCLMHLDGILFTGDQSSGVGAGISFCCNGHINALPSSILGSSPFRTNGVAACAFGPNSNGFQFDVGASVNWGGESPDMNFYAPLIACGNGNGMACQNGGFVTSFGNAILLGNNASGFQLWPGSGTQWDGGVFCNANGQTGLQGFKCITSWVYGPLSAGAVASASHFYRNGGWGLNISGNNIAICGDFGTGTTANLSGQIIAQYNALVQIWYAPPATNYLATCSPPFGTVGNAQSTITT